MEPEYQKVNLFIPPEMQRTGRKQKGKGWTNYFFIRSLRFLVFLIIKCKISRVYVISKTLVADFQFQRRSAGAFVVLPLANFCFPATSSCPLHHAETLLCGTTAHNTDIQVKNSQHNSLLHPLVILLRTPSLRKAQGQGQVAENFYTKFFITKCIELQTQRAPEKHYS